MTAPPSTETPHTATPWRASKCGYLMGTDDSEGAKGREVQVGKIGDFFDKQLLPFNKDRWQADLEFIVTAVNSHAALTAKVAELEAALRETLPIIKAAAEGSSVQISASQILSRLRNAGGGRGS